MPPDPVTAVQSEIDELLSRLKQQCDIRLALLAMYKRGRDDSSKEIADAEAARRSYALRCQRHPRGEWGVMLEAKPCPAPHP